MPPNQPRARHDEAYRLLFSSRAMVRGLLSTAIPGLLELIDQATLAKVSASFVEARSLRQRHGDTVWRATLREPDGHPIFLPIEFQSAPDPRMAVRFHEYVTLILQEAEVQKDCGAGGTPPIAAPVLLYNGAAPWNVPTDLADCIAPQPGPVLRRVLALQSLRRYIPVDMTRVEPPPSTTPADFWFSVLAEWEGARWAEDTARLARLWRTVLESGSAGIVRGFTALRQQIAPPLRTATDWAAVTHLGRRRTMIRHEETYMAAQLRKHYEKLRREGRREGRRKGRREGSLSVLRQMALRKFGEEAANEVSRILDGPADPDLAKLLAAALIDCDTGEEFIARVRGGRANQGQ